MADPRFKNVTALGSGAITENQSNPDPLLDRVSEFQYVTVTNILPLTLIGKVAQSRQVSVPFNVVGGAEKGVDENTLKAAGLDLKNPDHRAFVHTSVSVPIEAGQTVNLRGDEAKVIVRQLVNEAMAYDGNTIRRGNPASRRLYEERIVQGVYNIDDLLGEQRKSQDELVSEALDKENEKAFPTLTEEPAKKEKK